MSHREARQVMGLLSVVERGKGKRLIKTLKEQEIRLHFQCMGFGTAPTEMKDIFGIGSKDKDVIVSLAAKSVVKKLMQDFGNRFRSYSEYGGLMIVLKPNAMNRLTAEILNYNIDGSEQKGEPDMKNEHKHNLVMITVEQGYAEQVMESAKMAGASGGTIIRGRLAGTEMLEEFVQGGIEEERDILLIMAPFKISTQIMEQVNQAFGLRTKARGILCSVPIEKAYKI